ncbi:MAG: PD40 domain-containing protein [Acidobacteria bacterium]|nr:PD40 domain-containing protein [Acidobacteriota bacterium]
MKAAIFILIVFGLASAIIGQVPVFHQEVTWSPNGRKLSFTTYRKENPSDKQVISEIWVMDPDGSHIQKVADNAGWTSWYPNGKRLLFSRPSADRKTSDIYSVNLDGTGLTQMTRDSGKNSTPEMSPNGKKIAFISTRESEKYQLYVMDADGRNVKRLITDEKVAIFNPQWSPDNKTIVYYAEKGDQKDQVWTIRADGSEAKLLTNNIGHNTYPVFLPHGRRIVFHSNRDGDDRAIYTMNVDGSDIEVIPNVKTSFAKFSPDGKRIVFVIGGFPQNDVYVANADGTGQVKIK